MYNRNHIILKWEIRSIKVCSSESLYIIAHFSIYIEAFFGPQNTSTCREFQILDFLFEFGLFVLLYALRSVEIPIARPKAHQLKSNIDLTHAAFWFNYPLNIGSDLYAEMSFYLDQIISNANNQFSRYVSLFSFQKIVRAYPGQSIATDTHIIRYYQSANHERQH